MINGLDLRIALEAMQCDRASVFDTDRAVEALRQVKALRGFIDRYEAEVTSHLRTLHQRGESAPAADLHTRHSGVSTSEARRRERRAEALDQAPTLAAALADGAIGAEHADALANATSGADDETKASFFDLEADLANDAARMTPTEFARNCRDVVRSLERDHGIERAEQQRRETRLTKKIDREGMYVLNARMHPELGTRCSTRSMPRPLRSSRPVVIALSIGVRSPPQHSAISSPAGIRPIIIGSDGVALNVGRDQRVANRAQRRALRAMYRTCVFHGCDVVFGRCEIHHIQPWELGGSTDLANLLPLCSRHHHVVHDGGWSLHLEPDRTLTITDPGGRRYATVPLELPMPEPRPSARPGRSTPSKRRRTAA